mgnify:CR=1 FL=1|jgi:hypothetical protein
MNKEGRKKLSEILAKVEEIEGEICTIKDEEQEKFDNLPEGLQVSDKGTQIEEIIGYLEEAENCLQELIANIDNAMGG